MDAVCCDVLFFKQKTAYEMRISDWSSDVCSSDLRLRAARNLQGALSQRWPGRKDPARPGEPEVLPQRQADAVPLHFLQGDARCRHEPRWPGRTERTRKSVG